MIRWIVLFYALFWASEGAIRRLNERFNQSWIYVAISTSGYESFEGFYYLNNSVVYEGDCGDASVRRFGGTYAYRNPDNGKYMYEWNPDSVGNYSYYLLIGDTICDTLTYDLISNPADPTASGLELYGDDWTTQGGVDWQTLGMDAVVMDGANWCAWPMDQPSCNTPSPTPNPTRSPVPIPTLSPTGVTNAPTVFTDGPSASPTMLTDAPTPRPTSINDLGPLIDDVECEGMEIVGLDQVFPVSQSDVSFNALNSSAPGGRTADRRIWTNGQGISVYFSYRWNDAGEWVISNTSYTLIQDDETSTQYQNNSVPVEFDPYDAQAALWDHFSNDDIYAPVDQSVTLALQCFISGYPTMAPTDQPTMAPFKLTTPEPTMRPTVAPHVACVGLLLDRINTTCDDDVVAGDQSDFVVGEYNLEMGDQINERPYWLGVNNNHGDVVYYSDFYQAWVISGDGYGAVGRTTKDHFLYAGINLWEVYAVDDTFSPECEVFIETRCFAAGWPTVAPTKSPTTPSPTIPTMSPTGTPTISPTTTSPTKMPSMAPTGSPIPKCNGMEIDGADTLDGLYGIDNGTLIADKRVWISQFNDAEIFWSDSVLHNSWVLYSEKEENYWLSHDQPAFLPPLAGMWDLYRGASPFVAETKRIDITCFAEVITRPPTDAPTSAPSGSPTEPPTGAPSNAPTNSPSGSPTTPPSPAPSDSPSAPPSAAPTNSPEYQAHDFLTLRGDGDDQWDDDYAFMGFDGDGRGEWEGIRNGFTISFDDPFWWLDNLDGDDSTNYVVEFDNWRPPEEATWNQYELLRRRRRMQGGDFNGTFIGDALDILIVVSETQSPTQAPWNAPTSAPSAPPTVDCDGLSLTYSDEDLPDDFFGTAFQRQAYQLNGHEWWQSLSTDATISFVSGTWRVQRFDEAGNNLLYTGGDSLFPPSGTWTFVSDSDKTVDLTIMCSESFHPTERPTSHPTMGPTVDVPPAWLDCGGEDDDPWIYFAFNSYGLEDNQQVFWREPVLDSSTLGGQVNVTRPDEESGDILGVGMYSLDYVASDATGSSTCTVEVYVIATDNEYSSVSTCIANQLSIMVTFNQSSAQVDEESVVFDDETAMEMSGYVYHPELIADGTTCYVTGKSVIQEGNRNVNDGGEDTQTFAGVSASRSIWEVLIILLIICVICLACDSLRRCFMSMRQKQQKEEDETWMLAGMTDEQKQAAMAGVASHEAVRRATHVGPSSPQYTSHVSGASMDGDAPSSLGLGGAHSSTGAISIEMAEKKEYDVSKPPPSLSRPKTGDNLGGSSQEVPKTKEFWRDELLTLHQAGYKNEDKNLKLLIKYCVRDADGEVDKHGTEIKVNGVLHDIFQKKRLKKQKERAASSSEAPSGFGSPQVTTITPRDQQSGLNGGPTPGGTVLLNEDEVRSAFEESQEGGDIPNVRPSMGDPPAIVPPPSHRPPPAFSAAAPSQRVNDDSESDEFAVRPENFDDGPRPSELGL